MTTPADSEINKALFTSLVMMLSTSAMQQLGKLVNPATGKTEVSLEGAQMTIDLISMLREKTQGNRDDEEDRLIGTVLSTLQMNYVEVARAAPPAAASAAEPPAAAEQAAEAQPKAEETKDPRFRKSYGA